MKSFRSVIVVSFTCLASIAPASAATVVDFEDLSLPPASFFNGDPGGLSPGDQVSTPWVSGGVSFSNTFGIDADWGFPYWYSFAASNVVDSTNPNFENQYAAYPGSGYASSTYAVAFGNDATVTFSVPSNVSGFRIANTTYAFLTMRDGDPYFFSSPLELSDGWFMVTATGSLGGSPTGSTEYFLADFRTPSSPGLVDGWEWFDLSGLGAVDSISFSFSGSDMHPTFGLNTPAYFAMDDLTVAPVPEPGTWALGFGAVVAAWALGRRSGRARA